MANKRKSKEKNKKIEEENSEESGDVDEEIPRRRVSKAVENIKIGESGKQTEKIKPVEDSIEEIIDVPPERVTTKITSFLGSEPAANLEGNLQNQPDQQNPQENQETHVLYDNVNTGNYAGIYARDYESQANDNSDSVYPRRFERTINFGQDFVARSANLSGDLNPASLLDREETTAWRSNSQLSSWERDEDKKYETTINSGKKKRRI